MDSSGLILAGFATMSMFLVGVAVFANGLQQRHDVVTRAAPARQASAIDVVRSWLTGIALRADVGRNAVEELRRAGLADRLLEVAAGSLLGIAAMLVLLPTRITWPVTIVVICSAGVAARAGLRRLKARRLEAFVGQLPELARMLSNGVGAGHALPRAMARAAAELEEPAGSTLRLLTEEFRLGQGLEAGLLRLRERVPSRELGVLVSTLVIQQRAGGDAVMALREMSVTLERRKDLRREIRTMLAGVRATTYAVVGLGLGSILLLNGINPAVLEVLTSTTPGRAVLIVGLGLIGLGVLVIQRLVRVEV